LFKYLIIVCLVIVLFIGITTPENTFLYDLLEIFYDSCGTMLGDIAYNLFLILLISTMIISMIKGASVIQGLLGSSIIFSLGLLLGIWLSAFSAWLMFVAIILSVIIVSKLLM